MPDVRCGNCGRRLKDEHETPCPDCGSTRKDYHMHAEAGIYSVVGLAATFRLVQHEVKLNWPLLVVLVVGNLFSGIPAYFISGWWSVIVTFGFSIFSTIVGYYAITRIIRITTSQS